MGLNRFLSLSKSSVLPEINKSSAKSSKNSSKSIVESNEKNKNEESSVETQKIDKTLKNGKSATTTKKSLLWTLRITNKNKSGMKKDRLVNPSPINASPRSSLRSTKTSTPPPSSATNNRVIDTLNVLPKLKVKESENNNSNKIVNKNSTNVTKMQKEQLLQQIIDQQTVENQKQTMEFLHANKGVEALGVLVQYLVFNLDAFSCPSLKKSQQKTSKQLREARDYIDEMKNSYHNLETKFNERETYYNKREIEMQELHRIELSKGKATIDELLDSNRSQERIIVNMRDVVLNNRRLTEEAMAKTKATEAELDVSMERENDLSVRIQEMTIVEDELREKFHSSELEFSEKLQQATMRERNLSERITQLTKLLEELTLQADAEKRELAEKLNLSQDELSIMRSTRNSSYCNSSSSSSRVNESFHNKTLNSSQVLQDEVESLRCVLELKQSEISELRKKNCELQRVSDEASAAHVKCSALESRVEDLQVQLHARHDEEKELLRKLKQLQDLNDNVQKKSARMTLHNEELQYRLKQNADRYSVTLNELTRSIHDSSVISNRTSTSFSENDKLGASFVENAVADQPSGSSPPASPAAIVKGVVEKSDSVSWVLEMEDETPNDVLRMVRRAGSFRSEKCSPSPVPKRQKCQNNSIQQSASAASILRQQSSESSPHKQLNGRSRSKSVSATKALEPAHTPRVIPQIVRSISGNGSGVKNLNETAWKHNCSGSGGLMKTSSPNPKKATTIESMGDELIIDDENASGKNDFFLNDEERTDLNEPVVFHRDTAPKFKKSRENRGLITCDTTALVTSSDIVAKKLRRPKTSGGEALISGSNSEGEEEQSVSSSSTSSSAPSTPSISSNSTTSSEQQPIESIEKALLRWKDQNNTPMEVSWCEEGGPSESCV